MIIGKHHAVSADAALETAPGALASVQLTAGSDLATLILYDNASAASGTKLCTLKAAANTSVQWAPTFPYVFSKGVYADISGTGPVATVVIAA